MNLEDLLDHIFGGEGPAIVFDQEADADVELQSYNAVDDAVAEMAKPCLDMEIGGRAFGVSFPAADPNNASLTLEKDGVVLPIFLLDPEVDSDTLPEEYETVIPLGWDVVPRQGKWFNMEEVTDAVTVRDSNSDEPHDAGVDVQPESDHVDSGRVDVDVAEDSVETSPVDGNNSEESDDLINDARIRGTFTPGLKTMLDQPVVFMTGDLYEQGDHRNTRDGKWKRNEMTWGALLTHPQSPLTNHPESKSKQGASIVLAETLDGKRNANAVDTMYAVVIDIDSGADMYEVDDKLEAAGILALTYSSFNHGKTEIVLKHDDIMRKLKLDDTPTRPQIQEYLRNHHKDRYDEAFIQSIEVVDSRKMTGDGARTILQTPELDKFRVILPLKAPVKLSDLAPTTDKYKEAWADKVTGFVVNTLGVTFDATSCDVNRLFYFPRHKKGSEWDMSFIQGDPLDFNDIESSSKEAYVRDRGEVTNDPFLHGSSISDDVKQYETPSGVSLNALHSRGLKERLLLPQLIEAEAPDYVRRTVSDGKIEIECPFEHQHSTEGGTGTVVMDPMSNEAEVWTVSCPHDACQGRHKLEHLEEMMNAGWFDESCIAEGSEWLIPSNEPEKDEDDEEEDATRTFLDEAKELGNTPEEADIMRLLKRMARKGASNFERANVVEHLAKVSPLNKRELKTLYKGIEAELRLAERKADNNLEGVGSAVDLGTTGFDEQVEYASKRIVTTNTKNPRLFHYLETVARIIEDAEGRPIIRGLSERQFWAELNMITKWTKPHGDAGSINTSTPDDIAKHLYNSPLAGYPPLRGIVTSPIFTKEGEIINTPGYNKSSGLYYVPDLTMDVPSVSAKPTDEEVFEAKRLLIEEVFADFPLGGRQRSQIVKEALYGEGIPAVSNIISMLLLLFCREMVEGVTPGHLLTKPAPGTGASLLTDICSTIAMGRPTPAAAMPTNPDEMSKTLTTYMTQGANMIFFDNINHGVDSGTLASAMTAPTYGARLLGTNDMVETEVRCVWVLTGNNVQLSKELVRRLIMIDLDAQMADPAAREDFRHGDLIGWVAENRGELVWACLTLIQNWVTKGKTMNTKVILNSYENWSKTMGGILAACGLNGFLGNRKRLADFSSLDDDDSLLPLFTEWWEAYGDKDCMIPQNSDMPSLSDLAADNEIQLPIRLKTTVDGDRMFDTTAFGRLLSHHRGRVVRLPDGPEVMLVQEEERRHRKGTIWRLVNRSVPDAVS